MIEPAIHSHIVGFLPDEHPLAYEHVHCAKCADLIHSADNSCVSTWVESGRGCYCLQCFQFLANHENWVLAEDWGLPDAGVLNVVECDHVWYDGSNTAVENAAICARCGEIAILAQVELCEDQELIQACLKAGEAA